MEPFLVLLEDKPVTVYVVCFFGSAAVGVAVGWFYCWLISDDPPTD